MGRKKVMWTAPEQYVISMGGYATQRREIDINLENVGRRGRVSMKGGIAIASLRSRAEIS